MEQYTLNNGIKIPKLGFGVFQIPAAETKKVVLEAIQNGYRLIDTAMYYGNEAEVGEAIRECGLKREELFVTTKVLGAGSIQGARNMLDASLNKLNIEYIDLMLIHCPAGDNAALWEAMEEYVENGQIKSIGLSNFYDDDLDEIYDIATIDPVINQIECHVYRAGESNQKIYQMQGMLMGAWSPLSSAKSNIFSDPVLSAIGRKYGKTNAQIALRYLIERGIVAIVKTTHKDRMVENINIFDFELSESDMQSIKSLDTGKSVWGMYD
ncbi:aldo/keto reductase [Vibrio fluvialis]|nr:aldo/keto reductase [Vibrio fluvialis]